MFRIATPLALGLCALVAFGIGGGSVPLRAALPSSQRAAPELPEPPEVRSVGGVAHLALAAVIDRATGAPSFAYAGGAVAPTIRVRPGDSIVVDYTNDLPTRSTMPLDFTNLHFHGLSVSPKQPGDQVIMTMIPPGRTYRYVVHIPHRQAPGLYWYHPHPHGESNYQVAGGMSGLIVVAGVAGYAPIVRGLRERDIILRDYYLDESTAPLARPLRRAIMLESTRLHALSPNAPFAAAVRTAESRAASLPPVPASCDPGGSNKGVTINGVPFATITMRAGTRQFFRVANASANSFFDLNVDGGRLLLVASDGVPHAFHDGFAQGEWVEHVMLAPAARAEFIVAAPADDGATLQSACIDYGSDGDIDPQRTLARIAVNPDRGRGTDAGRTETETTGWKPDPFGNIYKAPIVARRSVVFSENNPDSLFYVNGKLWDPNAPPMFTARTGTVEEWTVQNIANELHAFHIHQIHFIVEEVNGVRQPAYSWRDTITLPYARTLANGRIAPGTVKLLMDFRDPVIAGTFVFHCHILEHEDAGMMAKIRLIGGHAPTRIDPDTSGYVEGFVPYLPADRGALDDLLRGAIAWVDDLSGRSARTVWSQAGQMCGIPQHAIARR